MLKSLVLLIAFLPTLAFAFAPNLSNGAKFSLDAVKFDKNENKWVTDQPDTEGPAAGYGPAGTLLRGGPKPFFTRIFTPDTYEQAVLKFMAGDKVGRIEAQANMDNFLENAQDWAYNRMQGYTPDYVTVKQKDIALRVVWSSFVVAALGRVAVSLQTGENFWEFLM